MVASDAAAVMDCFAAFPGVAEVLARGDTKMSVRLQSRLQVDLRVVAAESFGAALQYFTGSKAHNIVLRGMAKARGLKINEYGVFRGEKRIAGRTEEEVYAAVDLPWIPPELREARSEFDWAAAGRLPQLVELDDIRGDLHTHSTWTDGLATIEEMAEAAKQRGLKYIAITDHSKRATMANGLTAERLLQAMGRDRPAQQAAHGLHRAQGRRGGHPGGRRARPARRRAGPGRLGRGERPLTGRTSRASGSRARSSGPWRIRTCARSPIRPAG